MRLGSFIDLAEKRSWAAAIWDNLSDFCRSRLLLSGPRSNPWKRWLMSTVRLSSAATRVHSYISCIVYNVVRSQAVGAWMSEALQAFGRYCWKIVEDLGRFQQPLIWRFWTISLSSVESLLTPFIYDNQNNTNERPDENEGVRPWTWKEKEQIVSQHMLCFCSKIHFTLPR